MPTLKSQRVTWVDLARGVGILLVVIGHACGGIIDSNMGGNAPALRVIFLSIYSFHMPLFFVLSGLFIAERLKADSTKFIKNTFTKVARSYFTWAIIQLLIILMMGRALNHPVSGPLIPLLVGTIWQPVSQLWFLYDLFFMQILAYILVPRLKVVGFAILTVVVYGLYQTFGLPSFMSYPPIGQFLTFIGSFGLGIALGAHLPQIKVLEASKPRYALAALAAWLFFFICAYKFTMEPLGAKWLFTAQGEDIAYRVNQIAFYPAALCGTAMILFACSANIFPLRAWLEYLGRSSLPIFLTHIIIIAGLRIVLLKVFKVIDPNLLLVVLCVCGVTLSVLFFELMKKLKLEKLLAMI